MTITTKIDYSIHSLQGLSPNKLEIECKIEDKNANYIIHRALINQLATKRQGTASTKTRSEVRGGGRKPWKQKGSGRARAGSTRSPLWKGGGVTFGPRPRSFSKKINKKEWRLALLTLLKNKTSNSIIVEGFHEQFKSPKTKLLLDILSTWKISGNSKNLIILENSNSNILLSARNIPKLKVINADNLNIVDILNADNLIITVEALKKIYEVYNV
uniref:Large ribosomal subunit protein uL4c n=1 Tax=Corynoplastis japonica TaxID=700918 RepID=A0A1X9PU18_9RHOD|nr:50S ribosomal protein L4 [Corynoplastis japonica]